MQQWYLPEGLDPHLLGNMNDAAMQKEPDAHQGRFAMWIQTDEEDDVVLVMRGLLVSRRLRCTTQVGERIGQGQRCGLVQFTATAEVLVPVNSRLATTRGSVVRSGSDIIASLVHKGSPHAAMVSG